MQNDEEEDDVFKLCFIHTSEDPQVEFKLVKMECKAHQQTADSLKAPWEEAKSL